MSLAIRAARPADSATILTLLRELADYQRLDMDVEAAARGIEPAFFGPQPQLFCDIAEWDGEAAGFAVWFLHYWTFRGRHGLYLEDLFVRPAWRRRGVGKALMRRLAERCIAGDLERFEWAVMDSNSSSIAFYRSIGAQLLEQWKFCRLSGPALRAFANPGGVS
ncbi:MAG: GNAT family N-acetyltransferase [Bradyrhizobium sp.]|nr:GNAT family N-acetyltransferase [Bradyrhizobium sp.]MBV9559719.1 GNAT family N-acetyltransferase [Bradyrhizobium sp.]